ncbi:MAG: hypothetical protein CMB99_01055, partial [Flavobacteriaceae bacterium]|nr:hypothetical protein [Flavobacteriaceae bacterium]
SGEPEAGAGASGPEEAAEGGAEGSGEPEAGAGASGPEEAAEGGAEGATSPESKEGAGAGGEGDGETRARAAEAVGGEWGEVPSGSDVIASEYQGVMEYPYTVSPRAAAKDKVVRYDREARARGREKLARLEQAAGPACTILRGQLRAAVQASRTVMRVGEMEDGPFLDDDMLPEIGLGINGEGVFADQFRAVSESTFVGVLVDCSGSMDSSEPRKRTAPDGTVRYVANTKAAYAAITAMALHKAMRSCRIPHAVLGYTTGMTGIGRCCEYVGKTSRLKWSRQRRNLEHHVFVEAPGIADDGAAIPFITGIGWNCDGESVRWAAEYCAEHGGRYDRVILLVVADGLPAGADDSAVEGPYLRKVVQEVASAGIEVYGIGVGLYSMDTFRTYYPESRGGGGKAPTGSIEIPAEEGLSRSVLKKLTAMLTRGYGMSRRRGR